MIQKQEMEQIMKFVAKRWRDIAADPDSKFLKSLPNDFWMSAYGGKTTNGGYWITTLFYTENMADANTFKNIMMRWREKGMQQNKNNYPDLIQINKKR